MTDDATVPRRAASIPTKTLRLEVLQGADAGFSLTSTEDRVSIGSADNNDLVLRDPTVSRYHLTVAQSARGVIVRDLGSTNGTWIGNVAVEDGSVTVTPGAVLKLGDTTVRVSDGEFVLIASSDPDGFAGLRGQTPAMRRLTATLTSVAVQDVAVLVIGESGTGKELIARAIHDASARRAGPFVTVDCGAIPPSLFAAELFGHERGAYTGADRRGEGAFERADGGTLFLDEIGELPAEMQSALLGVLERRRVRRLGGRDEVPVDVRVVSATNRDLRSAVNAGGFRLDLFFRLAVVLLDVPPLRARAEDIPLLIAHFLDELGAGSELDALFPAEKLAELKRHRWPGNVRELKNLVASARALGAAQALPLGVVAPGATANDEPEDLLDLDFKRARAAVVESFERRYLARLMSGAGGNVRQAARTARLDRTYLAELLKKHGLHGSGR
jgi:DNA-binding NtrC family response regulator